VSRIVRKLVRTGDVAGLVTAAEGSHGDDRLAALQGILTCMETHAADVKERRDSILAVCVPLVRDQAPSIRSLSLAIATMLRDPSAPGLAVAALSDPSPEVRVGGLISVFHLRPYGSIGKVLQLLSDEDPWVRQFAAGAIERVGDRSSVSSLTRAREREEDPAVRNAIDDVVAILEGRSPPTPIEPFMEDPGS